MIEKTLDDQYWSERYSQNKTGWDIGYPSTPLKEYIDQVTDLDLNILIPGCGNAYEAEYLLEKGFRNVTLVDISEELVNKLKKKLSGKHISILHGDFFTLTGTYDRIFEQTFFCAIDPALRKNYVEKVFQLLKPGGKLVGVLFDREFEGGPPFGGSLSEYRDLFENKFKDLKITACYNSIPPRQGTEVFIIATKTS